MYYCLPASLVCAQGIRWRQLLALLVQKYNLTRLLHASYTPLTRLLHASYTPFTRPLHASTSAVCWLYSFKRANTDAAYKWQAGSGTMLLTKPTMVLTKPTMLLTKPNMLLTKPLYKWQAGCW
jgi:hypothetical protein